MGQRPHFSTSFPNPKGGMVTIDVANLYDVERKLRALASERCPSQDQADTLYLSAISKACFNA